MGGEKRGCKKLFWWLAVAALIAIMYVLSNSLAMLVLLFLWGFLIGFPQLLLAVIHHSQEKDRKKLLQAVDDAGAAWGSRDWRK